MSEIVTEKSWKITPVGVGRRDYSQNIQRFDEEPTLLLFEGFEELPPTWSHGGSTGYSVVRDTTRAWRGGACLKLTTGTDPADNNAYYAQHFGLVASMKLLLDLMFVLPVGGNFMLFAIHRYTGTHHVIFEAHYLRTLQKWQYLDPSGVPVDVPNGAQVLAEDAFHHIWLAVDFKTEEYLYVQCNEKIMSLKGIPPHKPGSPEFPISDVWIAGNSGVNPSVDFYIDNVRVAEVI